MLGVLRGGAWSDEATDDLRAAGRVVATRTFLLPSREWSSSASRDAIPSRPAWSAGPARARARAQDAGLRVTTTAARPRPPRDVDQHAAPAARRAGISRRRRATADGAVRVRVAE